MHALVQSRTRRSLTILIALGIALAGIVAARYALLPLVWHAAAMHFHAHPLGMHYHGRHVGHLIAMHYHAIVSRMHYHG